MGPAAWHPSIYEIDAGRGLAVCVRHRGLHRWYLGGCHALPAPQSRLERIRIYRAGMSTARAEPIRAEVDAPALAEGIAAAIYGLMERRREARSEASQHASPPASHHPPDGLAPITVWTEDDGSDS